MTLIKKPTLKVVPLAITADLSECSLEQAALQAIEDPHDGWADLIVHQSQLSPALRVAALHNRDHPALQVRVLTDTTLGHDDWKLKTRGVVITSFWTNKPE